MEKDQFEQLNKKLDLMLKMLALDKLHGLKQIDQVDILTEFGMRPSEIATILGRKTENITAQLAQLKKRPKKQGKKKTEEPQASDASLDADEKDDVL